MNESNFFAQKEKEEELLHKELALLAEKSANCEPELLADYAIAMCEIYNSLYIK